MAKKTNELEIRGSTDGSEMFVIFNGVKIAKRGRPGTAQAKTWVSLEPGWTVLDCPPDQIEIRHEGVRVH